MTVVNALIFALAFALVSCRASDLNFSVRIIISSASESIDQGGSPEESQGREGGDNKNVHCRTKSCEPLILQCTVRIEDREREGTDLGLVFDGGDKSCLDERCWSSKDRARDVVSCDSRETEEREGSKILTDAHGEVTMLHLKLSQEERDRQ
jgi:hypothetical protein